MQFPGYLNAGGVPVERINRYKEAAAVRQQRRRGGFRERDRVKAEEGEFNSMPRSSIDITSRICGVLDLGPSAFQSGPSLIQMGRDWVQNGSGTIPDGSRRAVSCQSELSGCAGQCKRFDRFQSLHAVLERFWALVWDESGCSARAIQTSPGFPSFRVEDLRTAKLNFQQILRRLEVLTRLTSAIAQTVKERLAVNDKLAKMLHRMHRVLDFVELAEPFAKVQRCPDVVKDTLTCITDCFLFIMARAESNPGTAFMYWRLEDLHTRMRDSLTLGVAQSNTDVQDKIKLLVDARYLRILSPLSMPVVAPHFRTKCFPGTRSKVISEITEWALLSSDKFLWMHAHAGSGKSTISTTMASVFESMGRLGSFVFFDRDVELRSEPSGMIRTIAYQLGCHRKDIAGGIRASVDSENDARIHDVTMDVQFRRLLVEPLAKITKSERLVIIIDALDEGGDSPSQAAFLSLLSTGLPRLPDFVRVLITSRNYPRIQRTFSKMPNLRILDLNQDADIDDDIRMYISSQMQVIRGQYSTLPSDWPGVEVIDSLVKHANGLFIWATVACSYIKAYSPERRINTLHSTPSTLTAAEQSLNHLYSVAIEEAGPWLADDFATDMHNILAIIVISQNPQSLQGIADLLAIDEGVASDLISRLESLLRKDENGLIHAIHPSVRDYLVDHRRCNRQPWFIDEEEEHRKMSTRCIDHLSKNLKRNMTVASDLNANGRLHDAIAYACISWAHHVCQVGATADLAAKIHAFICKHFLHWLEALSVLGESRNSIAWLDRLQDWHTELEKSPTADMSLNLVIYDGWRFAKAFSKTIASRPSLIYEIALRFCPKNTSISAMFIEPGVKIVSACLREWSPSLMTLVGGIMSISSLVLSPSGDILTASVDSATKIWKTSTGVEIFSTPSGYRSAVSSLLSSNGKRLVEAMYLCSICIWDVDAGKILTTFPVRDAGPRQKLLCAALAADDVTVVCGFEDGMVQIWNTESQIEVTPLLTGHNRPVNNVAFSHDQQLVLSGSSDHTLRTLSRTGIHQRTFIGHTAAVHGVAFSPDDSKIASVSLDGTMRVWETNTGSLLLACSPSSDKLVTGVAFSHKGDLVAVGSYDCNIRIWDSSTGLETMPPLSGHIKYIECLCFSPDDQTIISGSKDGQVRIWSLTDKRARLPIPPRHEHDVTCVALAHSSGHFVSGSADNSSLEKMPRLPRGAAALPRR
ncbi:hypothetical protein C8R47DRAFT_1241369 [Mycena vitilis]|nr:hypothetical protein C8R47DRAFT_1241369 [Mycena vitilis]